MLEIERKFLIKELPENLDICDKQEIIQGYFRLNKKDIRIRKTLSYKNNRKQLQYTMTQKQGHGLVRNETEKKISEKEYLEYRDLAKTYQLRKTRYIYPYNGINIEINQFHDNLDGLRMIEIEFSSIKESEKFEIINRFGEEITEMKEANNGYLATYGMKKLIEKAKYEDTITKFQLKSFYNQEAQKYSQTRRKHRSDAEKIINIIQEYPQKKIRILEIGCGSGRFLEHLKEVKNKEIEYTGVDLSENLLEEAQKITLDKIKAKFICKDMISFLAESKQEEYDIIVGIASFQHLPSAKQRFLAARYMYRCLNYEGNIIITNWAFSSRMVKKHRKIIAESIRKKILNRNKNERNNLYIPRKSETATHKRFYHIFTKFELKKIFTQSGFVINNLYYITKEGQITKNRKESNNTLLIAKKTIFI